MTNVLRNLANLNNKKVLLRVDFNVPIENGIVQNDNRIKAALPTIKYLLEKGAKLVLLSHLGRIKKISDKESHSLRPVANILNQLLDDHKVLFLPFTRGKHLEEHLNKQNKNEIFLLENTRFEDVNDTGEVVNFESKNDAKLGSYWASLGDLFVNDAFGTAHRSHASNVGIATAMKKRHKLTAVGFLIEKELIALKKVIDKPQRPLIAIVGGAKVSDKIGVLESLLKIADRVIVAGGMAFTFLKAQDREIGKSLFEPDKINIAKHYLKNFSNKIIFPIDFRCTKEFENVKPIITETQNIPAELMALDIGPKTSKYFADILKTAKTVIWNGPTGVFEMSHFSKGTNQLCAAIAGLQNAYTVIGGGDSAAAAIEMGYENKFSHISTGGGASLEFIEGKVLPGIAAIATV